MKTNEYLYGKGVKVLGIPQEVIVHRLKLLNNNLSHLLDKTYMERPTKQVNDILHAIKFWETINEI